MTIIVDVLTVDSARAKRAAILNSLGCSEEELRGRADNYALTARELAAMDEIEGLDYLLGLELLSDYSK